MSLLTHPDKIAASGGGEGGVSHELFLQMQRAYGYLTNPTTRIIYDRFGVQGIKVYEMYSEEFRECTEEMRTQDLEESKKKELETVSIACSNTVENREEVAELD
jgi:DnaJ-class molecular chaperone